MMSNVHPNYNTKSRQCQTLPEYDRAAVRQGDLSSSFRALPEGPLQPSERLRGLSSFAYAAPEHYPQ